jgi:hypothetical protein
LVFESGKVNTLITEHKLVIEHLFTYLFLFLFILAIFMAMGVSSANLQNFFELWRQLSNEKERRK